MPFLIQQHIHKSNGDNPNKLSLKRKHCRTSSRQAKHSYRESECKGFSFLHKRQTAISEKYSGNRIYQAIEYDGTMFASKGNTTRFAGDSDYRQTRNVYSTNTLCKIPKTPESNPFINDRMRRCVKIPFSLRQAREEDGLAHLLKKLLTDRIRSVVPFPSTVSATAEYRHCGHRETWTYKSGRLRHPPLRR